MIPFLLVLFVLSIFLLIPTILIQSSGADNGMMSSNITAGAFGAKSNEILVKFTSYLVASFLILALVLSIHYIRLGRMETGAIDTSDQISVPETDGDN